MSVLLFIYLHDYSIRIPLSIVENNTFDEDGRKLIHLLDMDAVFSIISYPKHSLVNLLISFHSIEMYYYQMQYTSFGIDAC